MLEINKFILKDVRCFKGAKEFNIRPLTFLVGENSTGKSTVVGCFQAMAQHLRENNYFSISGASINFNSEPFQMGSFENIARRARPKNKEFELGFEFIDNRNNASKFQLLVTLAQQANSANSIVKQAYFIFDDGEIIFLDAGTTESNTTWEIKIEERNSKKIFAIALKEDQNHSLFRNVIGLIAHYESDFNSEEELSSEEKQFIEFIKDKNWARFLSLYFRCFSFPPTQPKPKRTYDPLGNIATSSGGNIFLILKNFSIKEPKDWKKLYKNLKDFGTASGLFTDIKVRKLGGSLSDPFQLELKIRKGAATNLIDVGYGISQILPLLVPILAKEKHTFLMQQPEVHLHPKAQAAFTSLLKPSGDISKTKRSYFYYRNTQRLHG